MITDPVSPACYKFLYPINVQVEALSDDRVTTRLQ